jgi:thymidylate synthase
MQQDDLNVMMRNFEQRHTGERTFHMHNTTLSMTLGQQQNDIGLDLDNLPVEALKSKLAESNGIVNELMWRINSMNLEIDKVNRNQKKNWFSNLFLFLL